MEGMEGCKVQQAQRMGILESDESVTKTELSRIQNDCMRIEKKTADVMQMFMLSKICS